MLEFHVIDVGDASVFHGSCLDVLPTLATASVDSIVTDPPYELAFMGKRWDSTGIAFNVDVWLECLRVLKPGGHLLAFGGSRTWHRLAVAIEDAGFEIRDSIAWLYGSGFPKSMDISKAIDKAAGAEREVVGTKVVSPKGVAAAETRSATAAGSFGGEWKLVDVTAPATPEAKRWQGWGTALKPAFEPVVVARKPLIGTVAANVLEYGTGGLNIDGTRIGGDGGRWPANVMLDEYTAALVDEQAEASRFFYVAKANKRDRNEGLDELPDTSAGAMVERTEGTAGMNSPRAGAGRTSGAKNFHPTVKPTDLMRQLVRLVTPPGGTVLDPFTGSGSTGKAALLEGFRFVGIELTEDYLPIIEGRLHHATTMRTTITNQPKQETIF